MDNWLAIQANGVPIKLITPAEVSDKPGNTFVVSGEIEDEKRAAVQGYLRAWSKAMYVAEVDPVVVAAIARTAVPEEWEDPTFGQQYLDNAISLNLSVTEQLGDLQTDIWQRVQPPMQKFGVISEEVPVEDFLDASMIQIANDWIEPRSRPKSQRGSRPTASSRRSASPRAFYTGFRIPDVPNRRNRKV